MSKKYAKTTTSLVIVESPAKCKKIEEYLGPGYKCVATFGHLRQLTSLKAIDYNNHFETKYENVDDPKKAKHIEFLRKEIISADDVILASDGDREGEAIAWHVCSMFDLNVKTTKRIIFNEITETAIQNAVRNPTVINMNLVHSQQARQILDLLVGFTISPLLWKYISKNSENSLSAGRCQTPALKIIYENQQEINNSPGNKVYNTTGYFSNKCIPFDLNKHYENETDMSDFLENSAEFDHIYTRTEPSRIFKQQPEPLTTSRIQQVASNEMHISPKETMKICQILYEGGYITYMRTDSKKYSKDFIESAKKYIIKNYIQEKYIHTKIDELSNSHEDTVTTTTTKENPTTTKEKATTTITTKKEKISTKTKEIAPQEAHEAIRPTDIMLKDVPSDMEPREKKLYKLIWETTLESCMSPAEYFSFTSSISAYNKSKYTYSSETSDFLGWKIVKNKLDKEENNNKEYHYLLQLKQNISLTFKKITSTVTIKNTKQHYTEAKLVQLLEENGIGRPSTFATLIDKIQERGYVKKEDVKGKQIVCKDFELEDDVLTETNTTREFGNEKGKLVVQQLGIIVMEFLDKNFNELFNYEYTKNMEDDLDKISKGEKIWYNTCESCLQELTVLCEKIKDEKKHEIKIDDTHFYMIGKYGPVIKCIKKAGHDKDKDKDIVTFIPVKKDIDLQKLERGEYKLEDVIEYTKNDNMCAGKYQGFDLLLKKGKYGLYASWGENTKSLSCFGNRPMENITYEDILEIIEKDKDTTDSNKKSFTANIIRKLNDNISIRNGKFGDYIFYKTSKMTKPQFLKLGGFKEDYKSCDKTAILEWVQTEYKVK